MMLIGRLAPGVTRQQARARLQPIFEHSAYEGLGQRDPKEKPPQLSLRPCDGILSLRGAYEEPLRVLMGMVALVLMIACSNVAMLLMARNTAREREFILRVALEAHRLQLFRQLLGESMLLVGAGVAMGWLMAKWAGRGLAAWANFDVPITLISTC